MAHRNLTSMKHLRGRIRTLRVNACIRREAEGIYRLTAQTAHEIFSGKSDCLIDVIEQ